MCVLPPVLDVGTASVPACLLLLHALSTNTCMHLRCACLMWVCPYWLCRTHNLLVLLGRTVGHEQSAVARSAAQHCRWRWLVASLFVVSYSWLISMFLPYFSSLVGIVASSTYLVGVAACWTSFAVDSGLMSACDTKEKHWHNIPSIYQDQFRCHSSSGQSLLYCALCVRLTG
jgi:hypothetical protein